MALADLRKLAPGESPACSWRTETIMAKQVEERTIGVDVAKCWLDIYVSEIGELERIENTEGAIEPVNAMKAEIPIAKRLEGKSRKEFDGLLKQYLARMDEAQSNSDLMVSQSPEVSADQSRSL